MEKQDGSRRSTRKFQVFQFFSVPSEVRTSVKQRPLLIAPFKNERDMARGLLEAGEFVGIFVDTPLEICEQRDPKGRYQKARNGEISNFTGIGSPYERPEQAEIHLDSCCDTEKLADEIVQKLFV